MGKPVRMEDWQTSPQEFVAIDEQGKEVEHIDPVYEVLETPDCCVVNNAYHTYTVTKKPGYTYVIRERVPR